MRKAVDAFTIASRPLVDGSVFFIAEAGINHNGNLDRARDLVDVAADSGADAVKFQTYDTDSLVSQNAPAASYQTESTDAETQFEILERNRLTYEEFERLQSYCQSKDVTFLSTPFDRSSADLLAELDVPAMKLGSGELTNHPLLEHVAGLGRPMILSTGMATMDEVEAAVSAVREADPEARIALLHCTSTYPAPLDVVNLRAMNELAASFDVPVGYSDHTTAVAMPAFATAAGARIVEKHFTLDQSLPGPDHHASLEPAELDRAVALARDAAIARGASTKQPTAEERVMRRTTRKSLHAARPLPAGRVVSADDVAVKRPNDGLPPAAYDDVVGRTLSNDVSRDEPLSEADFE